MDHWKQNLAKEPTYRYFPNRTRKQTNIASIVCLVTCGLLTWAMNSHWANTSDRNRDYMEEGYYKHTPQSMQTYNSAQNAAFDEILLKARRKRLGLPDRPPMTLSIQDPETNPRPLTARERPF
eukprot:GDKI01049718.1.p1 GENE.GDKI01049718.1~~GDKI01049718.1.p1  ORF type:complete len:123 (-),score=11.91 GDKI01049718.1:35-403(-)